MIEFVVFDFGNVLSLPHKIECVSSMANILGLDENSFLKSYSKFRNSYDRGDLDGSSYWKQIAVDSGISLDSASIPDLIQLDIESWSSAHPEMINWSEAIRMRGTKTGILSNMPIDQAQVFRKNSEWSSMFNVIILSAEINQMKPEKGIYEYLISMTKCPPHNILFLDDKIENIEAASSLGLKAEVFHSGVLHPEKLKIALSELEIKYNLS